MPATRPAAGRAGEAGWPGGRRRGGPGGGDRPLQWASGASGSQRCRARGLDPL